MARWKDLEAAIRGMHRGTAVLDVLRMGNRMSVKGIREAPTMMVYRNISQTTVNNLAEICRAHGVDDCVWMKEVKEASPSKLQAELQSVVPVEAPAISWDDLIGIFSDAEVQDFETKMKIIQNLRNFHNVRTLASSVVPPAIHRSMYKRLISRMNQRLRHKGSAYRLKFEPAPDLAAGHGYVQIAVIQDPR
jgi:hypothetical protein